ncbi:MAG: CHRD domain-containing protein [Tsuneonella sp.]
MNKTLVIAGLASALALAGCATMEEEAVDATSPTYHATLLGANEPGGGDPDGMGKAEISISDGFNKVCWEIKDVTGIGTPTAAHIHHGAAGVNGPVVLPLTRNAAGAWQGCVNGSEWTQDRIEGNPQDFYVNVHTAEYPNGAIRGQLMR